MHATMQQAHVELNGVRTKVVTWGRWIEESPKRGNGPQDIILFITGNPGLTRFYNVFLQSLHQQTGIAVWAIGHAGHEPPVGATERDVPPLKGNEELYKMNGQIKHKVRSLNSYFNGFYFEFFRWIFLKNTYRKMLECI